MTLGRPWTFGSIDGSSTSFASKSCWVDRAVRHVGSIDPVSFDQLAQPSQSLTDRGLGLHVKRGPRAARVQQQPNGRLAWLTSRFPVVSVLQTTLACLANGRRTTLGLEHRLDRQGLFQSF